MQKLTVVTDPRSLKVLHGHTTEEEIRAYLDGYERELYDGMWVTFTHIDLYSDVGSSVHAETWILRNGTWQR